MTRYISEAIVMIALAVSGRSAFSQSCESRFEFKYADGQRGCLTDFSLAKEEVKSLNSSVERMVSGGGTYNIAMPPRDGRCPVILGMVTIRLSTPGSNNPDNLTQARSIKAMRECQKQLAVTSTIEPQCTCRIVLEDSVSPLTRDQFSSYVGRPAEPLK